MQTYQLNYKPTVLLVDGAFTLRRNMYQQNLRELSNAQGVPTGAIYGFIQSLKSAVTSMSANSVIVCWEGGHSERRLQVYDQYKHRDYDEEPEKDIHGMTDYEYYSHQLSWIKKILEYLGVHQLRVEGKEGDDVLYQAAHILKGKKMIISEDRDFYALVNEDISIYRPIRKEFITLDNFQEASGGYKSPTHYLYGKVLLGDGSDNIPSVAKGVGEGTVTKILDRIDNPEELNPERIITEAIALGNARSMKLAEAGLDPICRNLNLVDISKEHFDIFQLQAISDDLSTQKYPNLDLVTKLFNVLEFSSQTTSGIINRLVQMSEFPLHHLVDKDYIKSVMIGGIK